jgi:hypothetical protein
LIIASNRLLKLFFHFLYVICFFWNGEFRTDFPGDFSERATPVLIPNTEVKPLSGDGTAMDFVGE